MQPPPFELPLLLDGSTGTNLYKAGMPQGVCVEEWILKNPAAIIDLQRAFINAGSKAIYAPTFGANREKLSHYGLGDKVYEINRRLVELSKEASAGRVLIGGNMSPTGLFIIPFGETSFEELIDLYKEQAKALYDVGVDFFVVETMMSMWEARAAVIAIKDICDKPIFVTMTADKNGRTLSGNKASACLSVLQGMGVSAFGLNCSTGPDEMADNIKDIVRYARIPVIAKPNAGVPDCNGENKLYSPDDFYAFAADMLKSGVGILGGCCGTEPSHIAKIKEAMDSIPLQSHSCFDDEDTFIAAGEKELFFLKNDLDLSEELDCSGDLAEEFIEIEDNASDAVLIRVDTKEEVETLGENLYMLKLPLCVISDNEEVLELCARRYNGTLLINKKSNVNEDILKAIAVKYGSIVI